MIHPLLIPALAKTCGVIVFQEQVTQVLSLLMACSEGEADRFRKGLAKHEQLGTMAAARTEFVTRATARHSHLSPEAAPRAFDQIAGWGGYGFIEGHAASFALTGYKTAYLSVHHTGLFLTAPAIVVRGIIERKGVGASLKVEQAKPLRLRDYLDPIDLQPPATPENLCTAIPSSTCTSLSTARS